MIFALVEFTVRDFDAFWSSFQTHGFILRQSHGSLGAHLFQKAGDTEEIIVLFQWESHRRMQSFFEDPQIKESFVADGVTSGPQIIFLTKAGELEA